jgi:hypothetical protein
MITWLALLPHPLCPSEKKALRDKRVINFYSSLKNNKSHLDVQHWGGFRIIYGGWFATDNNSHW